ncbi:MAG: class I SAM-dependent methyltransferase [Ilumatobacter sp.]|nr:class I SAM-dependent methyltransferase [Ilumatobacter sp.]
MTERELREYYDREAAAGARLARGSRGRRDRLRAEFVDRLITERRHRVVDIGAGPGTDADAFIDAGLRYAGLDLSVGNARVAFEAGRTVVPGSLYAPPFRPGSFDAGWTMSTLLHVPDDRFDDAVGAVTGLLRPGSPLAIGLWGGLDQELVWDDDHYDPPRFFSVRAHDRIQAMLGRHGVVESFESWDTGRGPWDYQFTVLRV